MFCNRDASNIRSLVYGVIQHLVGGISSSIGPQSSIPVLNPESHQWSSVHGVESLIPCLSQAYNVPQQPPQGQANPPIPYPYYQPLAANQSLPFLATLDLPDLSRMTNDPIMYSPWWPSIPHKIPSNIPKFEGKDGEDRQHHITTFHLWCTSNSLLDDSIELIRFHRNLIGSATKCYIKLPTRSFYDFHSLAMAFLTHFQLPIRYETGTELLT